MLATLTQSTEPVIGPGFQSWSHHTEDCGWSRRGGAGRKKLGGGAGWRKACRPAGRAGGRAGGLGGLRRGGAGLPGGRKPEQVLRGAGADGPLNGAGEWKGEGPRGRYRGGRTDPCHRRGAFAVSGLPGFKSITPWAEGVAAVGNPLSALNAAVSTPAGALQNLLGNS